MPVTIQGKTVNGVAIGNEVLVPDNGWRTHIDENPPGIFKRNEFLYKINESEKSISFFFCGLKDNTTQNNGVILFDMSWIVTGITEVNIALPKNEIESASYSQPIDISFSGSRVIGSGNSGGSGYAIYIHTNLVHTIGTEQLGAKIYYTELV